MSKHFGDAASRLSWSTLGLAAAFCLAGAAPAAAVPTFTVEAAFTPPPGAPFDKLAIAVDYTLNAPMLGLAPGQSLAITNFTTSALQAVISGHIVNLGLLNQSNATLTLTNGGAGFDAFVLRSNPGVTVDGNTAFFLQLFFPDTFTVIGTPLPPDPGTDTLNGQFDGLDFVFGAAPSDTASPLAEGEAGESPRPVPPLDVAEPATLTLIAGGLAALGLVRRRRVR